MSIKYQCTEVKKIDAFGQEIGFSHIINELVTVFYKYFYSEYFTIVTRKIFQTCIKSLY